MSNEQRARIDFVRAGLDYLRLNTANQALVQRIIAAPEELPAVKAEMTANWRRIERIVEKNPLALPANQVANSRGELDYIHPESDHKALETLRLRRRQIDERLRANAVSQEPNLRVQ